VIIGKQLRGAVQTTLLVGMALTFGAPTLREPPKGTPDLVGVWKLESVVQNGTELSQAELDDQGRVNEFTKDGNWIISSRSGKADDSPLKFTVGAAGKLPAPFDTIPRAGEIRAEAMRGIVRVEGNTLTLCWVRWDHPRPTLFESSANSAIWLATYTRAKKPN
jgi:uncharacterized protein (TIGR03067 family)